MFKSTFVASAMLASVSTAQPFELLGYLENWVDVDWWSNDIPGNCLMGCFTPSKYIPMLAPYSAVNYGFTLLTTHPNPEQTGCTASNAGNLTADGACPIWNGQAIYLADSTKSGAAAITPSTTAATPGIVAMAEAARMAHMHPDGPKRFKICLGGWSDFARLGSEGTAKQVAQLAARMVLWTFADGIDLDFEHLTPFATIGDEFAAFNTLITALRAELDAVEQQWGDFAKAQQAVLQKDFDALPNWQKAGMGPYYNTTIKHLAEVIENGPNHLEISWTTRFNAFLDPSDPWSYLLPTSPVPSEPFATDNEGSLVYPVSGDAIDTVNIMAYDAGTDAGPLQIDFEKVLENFVTLGKVPASKINIGFEPGEQAAGGVWEGMEYDLKIGQYVVDNGFLGTMVWAVNPSTPQGAKLAPELASNLKGITNPSWRWGPEPNYTKCNPTTGMWPSSEEETI